MAVSGTRVTPTPIGLASNWRSRSFQEMRLKACRARGVEMAGSASNSSCATSLRVLVFLPVQPQEWQSSHQGFGSATRSEDMSRRECILTTHRA